MSRTHVLPDQQDPDEPIDEHAATRHLCAGAYLEREFSDLVLREVHNASKRRVAPSYGFDLVPVVRHAKWARGLEVVLHVLILASIIVPLVTGHLWATFLISFLLAIAVVIRRKLHGARKAIRQMSPENSRTNKRNRRRGHSRSRSRVDVLWTRGAELLPERVRDRRKATVLGMVVVAFICARHLDEVFIALAVLAGLVGATFALGAFRQYRLNGLRSGQDLRPSKLTQREADIDVQQQHLCVVYPRGAKNPLEDEDEPVLKSIFGLASPFVGAGEIVHNWNPPMTVQMLRPQRGEESKEEREYEVPPFRAHELVDHLRFAMRKLDADADDLRLYGSVDDRIYISERDASIDRRLINVESAPEEVARIVDTHHHRAHHFLEVSVPVEGGELVTTVLLRVTLKGRTLSLNFVACALTQTPQVFQRVDGFAEQGKLAGLWAALRAVRAIPSEVERVYRLAELPVLAFQAWRARKDRSLLPRHGVMIGTQVSVREEFAEEWGDVQLDKTKILDHMKILEERLLNATRDFLDSKEVDISEFEVKADQIITAGVVNIGGNNEFSNNAIGNNAQAHNSAGGQTALGNA